MSNPETTQGVCLVCRKAVGLSPASLALRHLYVVRNQIIQEITEIERTIDCLTRFAHVEITDVR